jgi:photosystem II stability/assembly factor-like uncharacterized protein
MTDTLHRYPGARPFSDDDLSQRTFFGREPSSVALTDQILANRLVLVYAKSGLGKTSLLNAGVAPRLRDAGSLPLFVRVNDIQDGPLTSVLKGIHAEAQRQRVEFVEGDGASLWSFFKTVEFWRDDLLLSPVLILDQFEELFTLQSEQAREAFLSELSYLVRGIPPPAAPQTDSNLSNAAPSVRVVLSVREDFLGLLEEASDRIPQIMDHRFRLAPLSCESAMEAITGPAAIDDPAVATKPFRLDPAFVDSILEYLTSSTPAGRHGGRWVEPFHLQLICQRIESVVAFKQNASSQEVVVTFKDFGGAAALTQTLESFYTDAVRSVPGRHLRGAVRNLCEQFLISPEGRRLSLDERELQRQLKMPQETLRTLVERRLLRTDRRSDSTYYELSHDALVQPILASRRTQALLVAWTNLIGGWSLSILTGISIVIILAAGVDEISSSHRDSSALLGFSVLLPMLVGLQFLGVAWLRSGTRRRRRYKRRTQAELTQPLPTLRPLRDKLRRTPAWVIMAAGIALIATWGIVGLFQLLVHVTASFTHGKNPNWLAWAEGDMHNAWKLIQDHPLMEIQWMIVEYAAIIAFGWMLVRKGIRRLWPHKLAPQSKTSRVPGLDRPPSPLFAGLKLLSGCVALFVAALGFFTLAECHSAWHGNLPDWLNGPMVTDRLSEACQTVYDNNWDWNWITFALCFCSVLAFSFQFLREGAQDVRGIFGYRRFRQGRPRPALFKSPAKLAAAVLGIAILAFVLYRIGSPAHPTASAPLASAPSLVWAVGKEGAILHTEDGGRTWTAQTSGVRVDLNEVVFVTPQSGWAVGQVGAILHTEDGGRRWTTQSSGAKEGLNVVAFATPRAGWAVGHEGIILYTEDGGETWRRQQSGSRKQLFGVAAVSPRSAWAAGDDGTILYTEDSGRTWTPQTSGTGADLKMLGFSAPLSGWAVGDDGTILHTDDSGRTWKQQVGGTFRNLWGAAFATPDSGWAVGDKGTIVHTTDHGRTWTRQASGAKADLVEVVFAAPASLWAVGDRGAILHSEDSGASWKRQASPLQTDLVSVAVPRNGTLDPVKK